MTDAEIIATAQFVSIRRAPENWSNLARVGKAGAVADRPGKRGYLVSWRAAFWRHAKVYWVDGDPHDPTAWQNLLVESYRADEARLFDAPTEATRRWLS